MALVKLSQQTPLLLGGEFGVLVDGPQEGPEFLFGGFLTDFCIILGADPGAVRRACSQENSVRGAELSNIRQTEENPHVLTCCRIWILPFNHVHYSVADQLVQ